MTGGHLRRGTATAAATEQQQDTGTAAAARQQRGTVAAAQLQLPTATASAVQLQGRTAAAAAANLAGAGFAGAAGVAVTWLVAASLGPTRSGAFFSATAAFTLASGMAKLGTQTGLVYWPARLRVQGQQQLLGSCLRAALAPVAVAALALSALLLCTAPAIAALVAGPADPGPGGPAVAAGDAAGAAGGAGGYAAQLRLLAVFLPLAVLSDCLLAATRGYRQLRPTILLDRVVRPALQLAGIGALVLAALWTAVPAAAYPLIWVAPYLPVAVLAGYALYTAHSRVDRAHSQPDPLPFNCGPSLLDKARTSPDAARPSLDAARPSIDAARPSLDGGRSSFDGGRPPTGGQRPSVDGRRPSRSDRSSIDGRRLSIGGRSLLDGQGRIPRAFWRFTWPRAVASIAQQALQRIDVLLVAGIAGLGAAAVYTVAGRFIVLGQLANQGITQAVQPRLAERLAAGDQAGANALYQTATGWLVLTTWPLYLLLIGNAPVYLAAFGTGYGAGTPMVLVLASAMLVGTGCGMVDVVLSMAGRTRWNLGNVLSALAVMVGMDLALIPRLGALGAALGLAAAVLVNNLVPLAQVGYALRLHPFGRGTGVAATLAACCFGILPLAATAIGGTAPAARLATVAMATAAYLTGAYRLRRALALDTLLARRRNVAAPRAFGGAPCSTESDKKVPLLTPTAPAAPAAGAAPAEAAASVAPVEGAKGVSFVHSETGVG